MSELSSPVVQRAFVPGWKKDFPRIEYDSAENSMRCTLCVSQKRDTIWVTTGYGNFRLKTVRDQAQSSAHLLAAAANDKTQHGVVPGMAATVAKRHSAVMLAMRACYWLVVEEVANIKSKNFMALLRDCGVADALALHRGANASHDSPVIFNELLACLSDVAQKELTADIRSSPFIGLGLDESTDRSMEKHLVLIVRYVGRGGACCTAYLQCVKIADGKAVTVVDAVKEVAATYKFGMGKVVGLGTDGASMMASNLNGVIGLLTNDNPHLVFMKCVCHRLNLAVSQACAGITDMAALQSVLAAVYSFIQLCPTRLERFKEMAAVLAVDTLKFKRIYEIRYSTTF